jgi:hypothetical protein
MAPSPQAQLVAFLLAPVIIAGSGCAVPSVLDWNRAKVPKATEKNPVTKIVCIWEPAEGQGLDGLPTRGFAGQILFFTHSTPSPVAVDGDVRVYLFDDRGPPEKRAKPIHQFDFLGKAWTIHLGQSTLGAGYNVFIPYVRKYGGQVNCTLRVRFVPESGPTVFSDTVNVTLPGPSAAPANKQVASTTGPTRQGAETLPVELGATLSRRTLSRFRQTDDVNSRRPEPVSRDANTVAFDKIPQRTPPTILDEDVTERPSDPAPEHATQPGKLRPSPRLPAELKPVFEDPPAGNTTCSYPATTRRFRLTPARSDRNP